MSTVGSATGSPTTKTLPAVQSPEIKNELKTDAPAGQTVDSAKASEKHATDQKGERAFVGSLREAEVRASLDKPKQTAPGTSTGAASDPPVSSANIDGQGNVSRDHTLTKMVDVKTDPGFKGLPKTTQDKLMKEIQKNPAQMEKLQKVLQHETYGQLSAEQKTKMVNVFTNCVPQGRDNLIPLMSRKVIAGSGDPPPTVPALLSHDNTKGQKTLLDHLDTVANQKLEPQLANRRGELLGRLIQETGRPSFTVNQGNVGTCAATTVQMHLLQHSPAEYARIISGLASPEKSVTLADGSKMDAALNQANKFLKTGPDPRTVTERMFQGAVQQYGDRLPKDQGGYGKDHKYDANNPDQTGLWDHQTGRVMKGLYNRDYSYHPGGTNGSRGIDNASKDQKVRDKMRGELYSEINKEIGSHQGPIAAHLKWGGVDASGNTHGLHEVLVEKIENGRVYFRNPWGSERTQGGGYTDGAALSDPPRRVEDNREGLESMSEADFKKLVNGATIGPPVGGA